MKTYIKGNYRKSIFENEKGYVIGIFKVRDTNDESLKDYINKTITFTGYFHELNEDDTYIFYGEEIDHPRYGFQYNVTEYERVKPEDKDGIIEFLSSDLFPGIGEKQAKLIVETLGEEALDKILEDESCLALVPRLSTKKAKKIHEILLKYEESHATVIYLTELGFTMKDALNIYNYYRSSTIAQIENNIYKVLDDVQDISFLKIDLIRKKLNIEDNDERRIEYTIFYIITNITYKSGDTYLNREEIYKETKKYLNFEIENFDEYLNNLNIKEKIKIESDKYYLKEIYDSEQEIIKKIKILISLPKKRYRNINNKIIESEKNNNIEYNEEQKEAIKKAIENNILIITGGPGTGKTTIIKAIIELYSNINKLTYDDLIDKIALLAPTGRASKRLSESTNLPATTIHRYLHWNKETNEFLVNEQNKSKQEFIIIDEVSMLDINILSSLFKGIKSNIKLILVGDHNQLPSVGPGQILKDLIESNKIDVINLNLLYRQNENSYINTLAHEIKNNELSDNYLKKKTDFVFLKCNNTSLKKNICKICKQIKDKGYNYKQVQVMAPMYKGENGIDNLNKELQQVFNPKSEEKVEIKYGDTIFRENDKILQLVNDPDQNVFNGDIGLIKYIIPANSSTSGKAELHIDFDGNIVKYLPKDFVKIKHGYIISIHKSQGSEFEIVVLPIVNSYNRMLYRKLIYTAITRAKKKLILIGEPTAFITSVNNNNETIRKTVLKDKLQSIK